MQIIWNEQNNEKLFAINEAALHKYIKGKSRSVNHLLRVTEWIMVAANFIVAIILTVDAVIDEGPEFQFGIAAMYLGYAVFALVRRLRRRQAEIIFEATVPGELDKALWQLDYLFRQGQTIFYWYILPLALVVSISFFLNDKLVWALAFLLVLIPVSWFGQRWEANRLYRPRKEELEKLRELLEADLES